MSSEPTGPLCSPDNVLGYEQACLIVENVLIMSASLYNSYSDCYKCKLKFWANVEKQSSMYLIVYVHSPIRFVYTVTIGEEIQSCVVDYHFGRHGVYKFVADLSCDSILIITPPDSPFTSMYLFLLIVLLLWALYIVFSKQKIRQILHVIIPDTLKKRYEKNMNGGEHSPVEEYELTKTLSEMETSTKVLYTEQMETETAIELISRGTNTDNTKTEYDKTTFPLSKTQLPEFDALLSLRGLIVTSHIFLLMDRGSYIFFRSSLWNGFRLKDVGVGALYWVLAASVYIRVRNCFVSGEKKRTVMKQMLLRSLLYIGGGLLYNKINDTSLSNEPYFSFRIFGVFQRFGVSCLVIISLEVGFMKMPIKRGPFFQDIIDCWPQLIMGVVLATVHTCITYLLPVTGCPTGYTGPGGLANYGAARLCTGGAAGYIDRSIFPRTVLCPLSFWRYKEDIQTYDIKVQFDPEGLLGTLNACFLISLAVQATRTFIYYKHPVSRIIRLLSWSFAQILIGLMLTSCSTNEGLVPPNVYLMSLSYVLLVSGLCYSLLLFFYLLIDVWRIWSGFPFIYTGANILVVYVGGKLLQDMFPFGWGYDKNDMEDNTLCLLNALWSVLIWTLVCYYLFVKNIFCPV